MWAKYEYNLFEFLNSDFLLRIMNNLTKKHDIEIVVPCILGVFFIKMIVIHESW